MRIGGGSAGVWRGGARGRWRCGGGCSVVCVLTVCWEEGRKIGEEREMGGRGRSTFLPITPRQAIEGIVAIS